MKTLHSSSWRHILGLGLLVAMPHTGRAGSIFDDNWKPPPDSKEPPHVVPPAPPPDAPTTPQAPRLPAHTPQLPPRHQVQPPAVNTGTLSKPVPQVAPAAVPTRMPVPAGAALAEAEKRIREVFASDYANTTPLGLVTLSRTLLGESHNMGDDAASLYVLLSQSRDLACAGGDPRWRLRRRVTFGMVFSWMPQRRGMPTAWR